MSIHEEDFEKLMQQYGDDILRLCYTYVHNWQTAEDLTQETFIRFYKYSHSFRADATYKTYLFRIAINVCKDYGMSWKHTKVIISHAFQKLLKGSANVEQQIVQKRESEQLVATIERLPPKYKDVLLLYYFAEMSLQEIADASPLTPSKQD